MSSFADVTNYMILAIAVPIEIVICISLFICEKVRYLQCILVRYSVLRSDILNF